MTHHPYWSYGPDHGTPLVDAMDEGRRAFALELAVQVASAHAPEPVRILPLAASFEDYLAGRTETPAARLADLEKSERKLIALETAGVDNWSGYDEAVADLDDED